MDEGKLYVIETLEAVDAAFRKLSHEAANNIRTAWPEEFLTIITTIEVPAIEEFAACEKFVEGLNDGVEICTLTKDFKKRYLNKREERIERANIKIHRLDAGVPDTLVNAKLGYDKRMYLAHFWGLLKRSGEYPKVLRRGWWPTVAHIYDTDGNIGAVSATWGRPHGGWHIGVGPNSIDYPGEWYIDTHFASR